MPRDQSFPRSPSRETTVSRPSNGSASDASRPPSPDPREAFLPASNGSASLEKPLVEVCHSGGNDTAAVAMNLVDQVESQRRIST